MRVGEIVVAHESLIRLGFFIMVLATMALWEVAAPKRALSVSKTRRWASNFGVLVVNAVLLRLLFPVAAVGAAVFASAQGYGLFNHLGAPYWLATLVCVIALDFAIYLQHLLFHAIPVLWRLHRMHHADLDFDVSTGGRFHPLEIILSMLIKLGAILFLGAPVLAVVMFEVLLSSTSLFNHSNVRIPSGLDRILRWLVVTPDMHRVHHSIDDDETNSNFGFNLPWWDRLLDTYRDQPRVGHQQMEIGIHTFRDPKHCRDLPGMLAIPFIGSVTGYAINRRSFGRDSPNDRAKQDSDVE